MRVLLVHGTWGRRSAWTFPASGLHERLCHDHPGATVDRFEWSGANRHRARRDAAVQLAANLDETDEPTVIVAHSHGGNVVEQALLLCPPETLGRVRVVTVGTPFLQYTDRDQAESLAAQPVMGIGRLTSLVFAVVTAAAFAFGMLRFGFQPGDAATAQDLSTWVPLDDTARVVSGFVVDLVAAVAVIVAAILGVSVVSAVVARLRVPSLPVQFGVVADVPAITTIRTRGDEAAGLLRFGTWIATAVDRSRQVVDRVYPALALGPFLFALGLVLLVVDGGLAPSADLLAASTATYLQMFPEPGFPTFLSVFWAAIGLASLAAVLVGALSVVEAVGCGFDGVPLLTRGRVRMTPEPSVAATEQVVDLSSAKGLSGLRHSRLMSDPNSVDTIARASRRAATALHGA